jgi:hypothetical protein
MLRETQPLTSETYAGREALSLGPPCSVKWYLVSMPLTSCYKILYLHT